MPATCPFQTPRPPVWCPWSPPPFPALSYSPASQIFLNPLPLFPISSVLTHLPGFFPLQSGWHSQPTPLHSPPPAQQFLTATHPPGHWLCLAC